MSPPAPSFQRRAHLRSRRRWRRRHTGNHRWPADPAKPASQLSGNALINGAYKPEWHLQQSERHHHAPRRAEQQTTGSTSTAMARATRRLTACCCCARCSASPATRSPTTRWAPAAHLQRLAAIRSYLNT